MHGHMNVKLVISVYGKFRIVKIPLNFTSVILGFRRDVNLLGFQAA
jgi:hypothetical protein